MRAQPNAPWRTLTGAERALLVPLFADSVPYDEVRIIHGTAPFQPPGSYVTIGTDIYAPDDLWRDDFTTAPPWSIERAILVHEISHVWQHGNGMDLVVGSVLEMVKSRGRYEQAYPYRLERDRDLLQYGMEQQASIIEDYYRITTQHQRPSQLENAGLSLQARLRLYRAVLGKFLRDPFYARTHSALRDHSSAASAGSSASGFGARSRAR